MNIIRNSIAAVTAVVLSLGFALPAAAQGAYGTVDSATQGTVNVDSSNSTNANVGVDVGVGVGGSADSNSGSAQTQGETNASGAADVSATGDVSVDVTPLIITRADVDSNAVEATSASASSVKTQAELSGFVAAQVKGDNNISAVEAASDSVAVTYKQHAKLFGFIPVTLDATATVDASGNVKISYPWYAFLTVTNHDDLQASIQSNVNAQLGVSGSVNASAQESAQLAAGEQARIVAAVQAAMQAQFDADVNARVNKVDGMTLKQ
ncbi:hypothetical protein A2851_01740 [Candidatus Kaiserbacteria bacterium RIFCSPHIGHO2_01_FULL_53_29]|uniref:Uncharacterized protein n=1 Tax=Candidatus Kaiserbacteria bacterium RIFCSPHIGHO2_01_FULL_53_29 TaxID=1798480 RepID=A0A1F6CW71_9BACT|nr:MAG: hypothetical protein A2851_01740 [Candidatus Kaiserbacteria bacterium RIFCSPHIGHO2_01_FULL_53_29]